MSRYYSPIPKEQFLEKIKEIMVPAAPKKYPYNLPRPITKDLNKVDFEFEVVSQFEKPAPNKLLNKLEGYMEIAPDFHVYFAWAGGDWEVPVTWIFYHHDDRIRAYIPKEGNTWNTKTKAAAGNDEDDNMMQKVNKEQMIADILQRITLR